MEAISVDMAAALPSLVVQWFGDLSPALAPLLAIEIVGVLIGFVIGALTLIRLVSRS